MNENRLSDCAVDGLSEALATGAAGMNENRLSDYLDHMQQAAPDACGFVEGLAKDDFLADKRTQQAVIMSLAIIGEAATTMAPDPFHQMVPPVES